MVMVTSSIGYKENVAIKASRHAGVGITTSHLQLSLIMVFWALEPKMTFRLYSLKWLLDFRTKKTAVWLFRA